MSRPATAPIMGTTHIIAVRHGETDWNVDKRMQGHLDVPLNATGVAQAEALAQHLMHTPVDAAYSSDLSRARVTAECLLAAQASQSSQFSLTPLSPESSLLSSVTTSAALATLPSSPEGGVTNHSANPIVLRIRPDLRERHYGIGQGLTPTELQALNPSEFDNWRLRDLNTAPANGGESLTAFHARVVAALQEIADAHPGQTVWVVVHGGVLDCWYRHAKGLDLALPRAWGLPNASLNRIDIAGSDWQILDWANTEHLAPEARSANTFPDADHTAIVSTKHSNGNGNKLTARDEISS